jgi:hypothetical protein
MTETDRFVLAVALMTEWRKITKCAKKFGRINLRNGSFCLMKIL